MTRLTCCCCAGDDRLLPDDSPAIAAHEAPPGCAFTIGHSTRPIAEFLALLTAHGVTQLVDVRTVPHSRHNPQSDTVARGHVACEIASRSRLQPHRMTPFARVDGGTITYPP